jgi:hypothetical protein
MTTRLIDRANGLRAEIKAVAADVLRMKSDDLIDRPDALIPPTHRQEAIANAMLAYRHLEDASMRLGKVIQALDGGVSVYDKRTTVGA